MMKKFLYLTIAALALVACGVDDEILPPVWEPNYDDYQIECTVTQQSFPCAGGEASVILSLAAYDDNGSRYEYEQVGAKRRAFSSFCMAKRLSPGFYLRSGCSSKRIFYFFLRHFRCPTTVVQLPHSCGATASQLWCNCPTAVGPRESPLKKQKEGPQKWVLGGTLVVVHDEGLFKTMC